MRGITFVGRAIACELNQCCDHSSGSHPEYRSKEVSSRSIEEPIAALDQAGFRSHAFVRAAREVCRTPLGETVHLLVDLRLARKLSCTYPNQHNGDCAKMARQTSAVHDEWRYIVEYPQLLSTLRLSTRYTTCHPFFSARSKSPGAPVVKRWARASAVPIFWLILRIKSPVESVASCPLIDPCLKATAQSREYGKTLCRSGLMSRRASVPRRCPAGLASSRCSTMRSRAWCCARVCKCDRFCPRCSG